MSAPDKEPHPLGSTSGTRGYICTCVRCGVTLYGVGRRAKYCPKCRADVTREKVMDYMTRNPEKVRAAYAASLEPPDDYYFDLGPSEDQLEEDEP